MVAGSYRPDRCGVADYTARLRRELSALGVESVVLTDHAAAGAAAGDDVVGCVRGWSAWQLPPLASAVRRLGVDLLHVQHAAGTYGFRRGVFFLPPLLRASGWRGALVTTAHEYGWWEWRGPRPFRGLVERAKRFGQAREWWDREDGFLLTGSRAIVAPHEDVERVIVGRLPGRAARVARIPIGANVEPVEHDRAAARARLLAEAGWPSDAHVVAFFGFLHPVKGLETLLPAFRRVHEREPRARLLLVGGVESLALRGEKAAAYGRELDGQVQRLGLGAVVRRTGYLSGEEVSRRLSGADLGALPFNHGVTLKSGSLLALLGHGVPVVATRADPPAPALEEERFTRIVPPREEGALADALLALLRDGRAQRRMAEAGREFAGGFAWPRIARRHAALYRRALRSEDSYTAFRVRTGGDRSFR